jgi:excisionase family DNA binding protein
MGAKTQMLKMSIPCLAFSILRGPIMSLVTVSKNRRLVSLAFAGEYLGVSEPTLRRAIASGQLKAFRVGTKLLRIDFDELESFATPIHIGQERAG